MSYGWPVKFVLTAFVLGALALVCASASPSGTMTQATSQVPWHVPTWSYDDGCNGGIGASSALVKRWLNYAESSCGPRATKALRDCRGICTAVQYADANWIYARGSAPVAPAAREGWWLHAPGHPDSAHRISKGVDGGGHLLNQANPAVRRWFRQYLRRHYGRYPALMMDDTAPSLSAELYGSGQSSTQEIRTNSRLEAAHEEMAAAPARPDRRPSVQVDDALTPNPYLPTPFATLGHGGIQGFLTEGAPMNDGQLTPYYSTLLDEIAYVDQQPQGFLVMLSYDHQGSPRARRVQAATELLGYADEHLVSWSDLAYNGGDLSAWPEQGIVPTQALESMTAPGGAGCLRGQGIGCAGGGHLDLQVAKGVYRREFAACYDQGKPIGPCAAIVNTTGSAVTVRGSWLSQSYGHQIAFNGGDVQSRGTLNLTGSGFTSGQTSIPASSAILLSS